MVSKHPERMAILIYAACQLNANTAAIGRNVRLRYLGRVDEILFNRDKGEYHGNFIQSYTYTNKSIDYVVNNLANIQADLAKVKTERSIEDITCHIMLAAMHTTIRNISDSKYMSVKRYVHNIVSASNQMECKKVHKEMYDYTLGLLKM